MPGAETLAACWPPRPLGSRPSWPDSEKHRRRKSLVLGLFFLNCALFRAKLEKASSNSYRRLQGVLGSWVWKEQLYWTAAVLFCLQHLDILKGGAKRKKKKSLKITINHQNKRKGKAGGPRGTSWNQTGKHMVGPHAPPGLTLTWHQWGGSQGKCQSKSSQRRK